MRILICALDGPDPRTNGIRLAVSALLEELRKSHEVRYIGYRMADQGHLVDNDEMRLIAPPTPPPRGLTLLRATLLGRPWETDRLAAGLGGDGVDRPRNEVRPDEPRGLLRPRDTVSYIL